MNGAKHRRVLTPAPVQEIKGRSPQTANMIISFLSGKGGTGKTTAAVNFALALADLDQYSIQFLDCDVEEPNAHIFLKPDIAEIKPAGILVPVIDRVRCNFCATCQQVCAYNAIAVLKDDVLVFHELCHGCGGCTVLCPEQAVTETTREIGVIERGTRGSMEFIHGRLRVGEPMASPLIREVKKTAQHRRDTRTTGYEQITVIDVPPGTSCPVIEAVKSSDYAVLVTEPTPFGLHDLDLAVQTVRVMNIQYGVVINRSMGDDFLITDYCEKESIPLIMRIPFDRDIAVAYSRGEPIIGLKDEYRKKFRELFAKICMQKNHTQNSVSRSAG
jgi:MinD superfamily P-loop ATPase